MSTTSAATRRPAEQEPTGALDLDSAALVLDWLRRLTEQGTTVVMATHDRHIVDSMRRRVIEFRMGEMVRDDATGVYGLGR